MPIHHVRDRWRCAVLLVFISMAGLSAQTVPDVADLTRKAAAGDPEAQNRLGVAYQHGEGVSRDVPRAIRLYRQAADQGLLQAQLNLAWTYNSGIGVRRDYGEAARWYRLAADQGHAGAQGDLGVAYLNGEGVQRNVAEAVRWLEKSSAQGYAVSTHRLAFLWLRGEWGRGAAIEPGGKARDLLRAAAGQGYPLSAVALAEMYASGMGSGARDPEQACLWMRVSEELDKRGTWTKRQPAAAQEVTRRLSVLRPRIHKELTTEQFGECQRQADQFLSDVAS